MFWQALRKGIATMDEDGFIGKDEVVMQVQCYFSAIYRFLDLTLLCSGIPQDY